jgi:hypothetical protein
MEVGNIGGEKGEDNKCSFGHGLFQIPEDATLGTNIYTK